MKMRFNRKVLMKVVGLNLFLQEEELNIEYTAPAAEE